MFSDVLSDSLVRQGACPVCLSVVSREFLAGEIARHLDHKHELSPINGRAPCGVRRFHPGDCSAKLSVAFARCFIVGGCAGAGRADRVRRSARGGASGTCRSPRLRGQTNRCGKCRCQHQSDEPFSRMSAHDLRPFRHRCTEPANFHKANDRPKVCTATSDHRKTISPLRFRIIAALARQKSGTWACSQIDSRGVLEIAVVAALRRDAVFMRKH